MVFVNSIGEVVHRLTDRYLGAANKNIGDAFLLVWRLSETMHWIDNMTNEVHYTDENYIQVMSDYSVLSFLRIHSQIHRQPQLIAYREDERLQERISGFSIKMGFGMHIGWGIEGAIGSEFKIDASYLSPNVNMAARLEAATKQYGVPLLISSDLVKQLSLSMRRLTR